MGVCQGSTQQKNQPTKKLILPQGGQRQRQMLHETNFATFLAQIIRDLQTDTYQLQLRIENHRLLN
ncbi:hypothetical protein pb186bvf_003876 [Paramecium bursaria]